MDHNKLWKILQEMGIPDHLICLLRNLYAPRGRGGQALTAASGPDLPCRAAIVRRPRGNPSPRAAPLPRYLLGGARSASKFPGIGLKIPAPAARRGPAGLRAPGPRPHGPGPPASS